MYLVCCAEVILNEIKQGCTQKQIAQTYAMAIVTHNARPPVETVDWRRVNTAIMERWSFSGLERVKKMAWKEIEARGKAARALAASNGEPK